MKVMPHISLTNKFRLLHVFTHVMALVGIIWAIMNDHLYWLLVAFLWFLFVGVFGVNVALHRYFAHNSFKTTRFGYWFLLACSFFPMLGSPAAWGSIHRFHHIHSDTELDPHCPSHQGKIASWFTAWPEIEMPLSIFRSFARDKNILFLHAHYFSLAAAYVLVLSVINWPLVCFVFAIPAVGCFHGAAAIAVIPHITGIGGYRNHPTKDNSHNHVLAWILSLGEGWHNNHHHDPQKYRHGERWWEFDPPAFFIKYFLITKR